MTKSRLILFLILQTVSVAMSKEAGDSSIPAPFRLRKPIRLLVVAPHPDDEVIMAGGLMLQNRALGGQNEIVYVTSGSHPHYLKFTFLHKLYRHLREREAIKAMEVLGVSSSHLHFLRLELDAGKMPQKTERLIAILEGILHREKPDWVLTSAYEGGHCVHDWTNYAVFAATRRENLLSRLYEAAEYRPDIRKGGEGISGKKMVPLRFLPRQFANILHPTKIFQVELSSKELTEKRALLKRYRSQNLIHSLTHKFGKAERFRPFPGHDYSVPPFLLKTLLASRKVTAKQLEEISYGECSITFRTFRSWIRGEERLQ